MQEVEFTIPRRCDLANAARLIEEVCSGLGLNLAMKGTLATYPGCVHWHYKKQKEKGTLELTLLPSDKRIWASVHTGRRAPWIEILLPRVQRAVELALRRTVA
jgi:hypothetical protein